MRGSIGLGLATIAACSVVSAIADATPRARRVAVLEFDGSRELADAGRAAVLSAVGNDATIVPAKDWTDALALATGHGPERWQQASSRANVDAVIEGWVQPNGRRTRLTIAVRDAVTGAEIQAITVAIDAHGVPAGETHRLASHLHEVLDRLEDHEDDAKARDHLADEKPALETKARQPVAAVDKAREVPPPAAETEVVLDREARPRFDLDGGPYVSGRGMAVAHGTSDFPSYPGQATAGIAVHADAYPLPKDGRSRALSGPGLTLDFRKSLISNTASGVYSLNELAWQLGLHYRLPIASIAIDLDVDAGDVAYRLVDRPASIAIPNASYSFLGGGAHVDLTALNDLTLGLGAHYMYLLGVGEQGEPSWYGAGLASGMTIDGDGTFDINQRLYIKSAIEYDRIEIRFDGSGALTQMTGRMTVVDSAIRGAIDLGVRF